MILDDAPRPMTRVDWDKMAARLAGSFGELRARVIATTEATMAMIAWENALDGDCEDAQEAA